MCSCPTSKMSCTTEPFLHRTALGKCTLLVPNSPWDLISAPLLTVHNLSVHFKTLQTNPFSLVVGNKNLGKGAPARDECGDPDVSYGKPTFHSLFHIVFRKQRVCDEWNTGNGLMCCCFFSPQEEKLSGLTCCMLCASRFLEDPLCDPWRWRQ